MTEDEWLEGLRGLPDDVILKIHFDLQEKIKKHYKLRDTGKNLEKAIHYCQQQIALAPLAMSAMKKNPGMYDNGQFFALDIMVTGNTRRSSRSRRTQPAWMLSLKRKRRKDGQTKDVWFATIFLLLLMGIGI